MLNRSLLLSAASSALFVISGCALQEQYVPASELRAAHLRAQDLHAESQGYQAAHVEAQQMIAGLQSEQQSLSQSLAETQEHLATANERVENLLTERAELKDRYTDAVTSTYDDSILTNYGAQIEGFEYDAVTGLYRYTGDVQFDLGSAVLRPQSIPVLKDFAAAVSGSGADASRILIVGHTDDLKIVRGTTSAKHATNWHLSTNRADAVIVELARLGVDEERMAAMGYSKFQPLEASTDDAARQRNRRVELYLVPAGGQVAKWDPMRALR